MEWNVIDLGNGLTKVTLSGKLDLQGALAIDPVFSKIAEEKLKVVADLSGVSFLASLGIRTLVMSCKTLAAKGGNLVLMSPPYYGNSVLVGKRRDESGPLVSDVQLLLDLAHFPLRGPEAAEVLIRRRIAPAFDLSAADVSRLVQAVA